MEEGPLKWVDLRFRVEDRYELPALAPEAFSFLVKSTDAWTVTSYNPEWCIITPDTGEGNPVINEAVVDTVVVQYSENNELDDRIDTLEIKSDYWVGKLVTVYQKGIAYLSVKDEEQNLEVAKTGGTLTFTVDSNQDWSTVVIEGAEWLSIVEGETGAQKAAVKLAAKENTGEKRYGAVSVLDRHGVERAVINVTQDGLQLDPATLEVRAAYNQDVYELEVVSNVTWKAVKTDEKAQWFTIENPENTGSATLRIVMNENAGNTLRKTAIKISTVASSEGELVIVRDIVLKQAYFQVPQRTVFDNGELADWKSDKGVDPVYLGEQGTYFEATSSGSVYARLYRSGMPMGTHTFRWHTFAADARVRLWWTFGNNNEIKYNLRGAGDGTGYTEISTSPSGPDSDFVNVEGVDMTVPHEMTVKFTPSEINEGYCHVQFILDGEEFQAFDTGDNVVMECTWMKEIGMYFGCYTGSAICEWYEYTEPFSWD